MADERSVKLLYSEVHDMEGTIAVDFDEVKKWAGITREPTAKEVQEYLELDAWDMELDEKDFIQADNHTIHEVIL